MYLLDGELDNTQPGKVTGWMRFAGMEQQVTFDLNGDFHRDIRGAKIRLRGEGQEDDTEAAAYMGGFEVHQIGKVGDITAGLPPRDYVGYPYIEWYGDENGRVVVELEPAQLEVLGRPIPACESDPISREQQAANMAEFLASVSKETQVPAIAVGNQPPMISDPAFTHWVLDGEQIIGEAHTIGPAGRGMSVAFVRLYASPEAAELRPIETAALRHKSLGVPRDWGTRNDQEEASDE